MRRIPIVLLILFAAAVCTADDHAVGRVPSADGVEIAYETWGAGDPAVVLVHGWSCDRTYWRDQVDHLARTHRVVAVDLAGHGESGLDREDYTVASFGADVAAVLRALDLTGAILVGHSMGGPVVVETALLEPGRVRGLVGIDNFQSVAEEFPQAQIDAFTAAMKADFQAVVRPWVRSMFPAGADSALVAEIADDMAAAPPEAALSAMENVLPWFCGGGVPSLEKLPVNLVCVSADLQPTHVEENRKVVPGFRVWIQEGVGHFLMREDPATFNGLLDEALASFDAAPPSAPGGLHVD